MKISLETLSHIDVNDLYRLGAFTEVTKWFPNMRLETNRWVAKYFHAGRPPIARHSAFPSNGHTAPSAERGRGSCAFFAAGGSASSIVPMASLVVGRRAQAPPLHESQAH